MQKQCVFWLFAKQVNILKQSGQICFVFLTNLLKENGQTKWLPIYFACAEDYLEGKTFDVEMMMMNFMISDQSLSKV